MFILSWYLLGVKILYRHSHLHKTPVSFRGIFENFRPSSPPYDIWESSRAFWYQKRSISDSGCLTLPLKVHYYLKHPLLIFFIQKSNPHHLDSTFLEMPCHEHSCHHFTLCYQKRLVSNNDPTMYLEHNIRKCLRVH